MPLIALLAGYMSERFLLTLELVGRRRRSLLAVAGCGLVSVLCSACGAGAAPGAADQRFLAYVHAGAPDVASYRNDTQLIRLGHAACNEFSGHASYEELADRLTIQEGANPLPSEDLGTVITAAVDAFCPQFRPQIS